jgi:hypothetical protein
VLLAELDGGVDQLLVILLLGRGEDERRVGRGILGLVLVDGRKVTGVADDSLRMLISPRAPVGDMVGHLRCQRPKYQCTD